MPQKRRNIEAPDEDSVTDDPFGQKLKAAPSVEETLSRVDEVVTKKHMTYDELKNKVNDAGGCICGCCARNHRDYENFVPCKWGCAHVVWCHPRGHGKDE